MKVIFLDIDGVLNSTETAAAIRVITGKRVVPGPVFVERPFTRENLNWGAKLVARVKRIVDLTDAKVVIVSSWREKFIWPADFSHMFAAYGWNPYVVGVAPIHLIDRGEEVNTWIADHYLVNGERIENYVIIDDVNDYSREQQAHLVQTNSRIGIQHEDVLKAVKILTDDSQDKEGIQSGFAFREEPE